MKIDFKNIEDISKRIKDIMPNSLKTSKEEVQKTLKSGADGFLQKLDLVTREEYEIQLELLNKCYEKIDELEKKIEILESKK
ncbi:MAG: accessory factor UbiK family protein [Pseudomonadota bacterium]|jgi:BMFP domain-containing protein YqiC|nr:accessory factor UbiK family protein [Pseudomonadota bacterium]|tara:strand:- start:223 stop:468 length:246 start_codon:yes stop_codon:yes gene_type:complete